MDFGIERVPLSTVHMIADFQKQAGIRTRRGAMRGIMFLNQALVRNDREGLALSVSKSGGRIDLADLYQGHVEMTARKGHRHPENWHHVEGVDSLALDEVSQFLRHNHIDIIEGSSHVVSAMVSLARGVHSVFHSDRDVRLGAHTVRLMLPVTVVSRALPFQPQKVHVYLEP